MNTVELVLVILLSVGFLTLIVLSIVLISFMIAIMRNIKRIASRAEKATDNVAGFAEVFGRKLAPLAASGLMGIIYKRLRGKQSKGK